jgi:hypothetical protein
MIQSRYIQLYTIIILMFVSCDFSEENINEEAITEATISELFKPAITQIAFNQMAISGRTAGVLMQYFSEQDAQVTAFTTYNFGNTVMDNFWSFGIYAGSLRHANELQILAEKEGNTDLEAIAQILKVNEFLHATTIFGDIPLTDALLGSEQIFPTYDNQESIYQKLIDMSNGAIEMIGSNGVNTELVDADIVFQGDMSSWKKFAYGLKARLHLHLTTKDAENYDQVLTSVENSFLSNNEQPIYKWMQNNVTRNPLLAFAKDRPSTFIISDQFAEGMINKNDPRKEFITIFESNDWDYQNDDSPLHWSSDDTSLPLLSFAELRFMKAEALLQTGASNFEVIVALGEGIIASCGQLNLGPLDYQEYLNTYATFDGLNTKEEKLERIITEAYYSYYGYAFQQSWNNYKRLKLPNLTPTGFPNDFDPSGNIPVRLLYPTIELELNPVNTNEAIDRQNGALLDEPLWVFK